MKRSVYLDYAAATPLDPSVVKVMEPYFTSRFYNPSALYLKAQAVAKDIDKARRDVAIILGAKPAEIIFTAGGTEANNLSVLGVAQQFPGKHIVASAIEHESVLKPLERLQKQGWKTSLIAPYADGLINPYTLTKAITKDTVLVSIIYANNEIGTIQKIADIAQVIKQERQKRTKAGNKLPIYLHTDACQATNYLDLHVSRLGVDLMTLNAGKIYGPKQCGALYIRSNVKIDPLILGGGQERGMRSGTENVAAIIGFAQALNMTTDKRQTETRRLQTLQSYLIKQLAEKIPSSTINGSLKHRLPNNLNVSFTGQDNERLVMALDEQGIECATGSACSASNSEPSHVLSAIGLSESEIKSSVRFSLGRQTTKADLDYLVNCLKSII